MWDNRVWNGILVEIGHYSITLKLESAQNFFSWSYVGDLGLAAVISILLDIWVKEGVAPESQ
ncbi:hypothetical protein H5410_003915, partial [Solanum commersonii]